MDVLHFLFDDHQQLGRSVDAFLDWASRREEGEAAEEPSGGTAEELEAELLEHFGVEEEVLFPFLVRCLPELAEEVALLIEGHERICGALTRLNHGLRSRARSQESSSTTSGLSGRLAQAFRQHSELEARVLAAAEARLTAAQRAELIAMARGLL